MEGGGKIEGRWQARAASPGADCRQSPPHPAPPHLQPLPRHTPHLRRRTAWHVAAERGHLGVLNALVDATLGVSQ